MLILVDTSVIPEKPDSANYICIRASNAPCIAVCPEVFAGVKTEATQVAGAPYLRTMDDVAMCLGCVFDDDQVVQCRKILDRTGVHRASIEVNRNDGASGGGQSLLRGMNVQVKRKRIHIRKHRFRSSVGYRFRRREK